MLNRPVRYCRAWEPEEAPRLTPMTPEEIARHEEVTVMLQRKGAGLERPSRLARVIESPVGGVLFVVLLGVSLVLWLGGAGW